jgi:Sel1 repeat
LEERVSGELGGIMKCILCKMCETAHAAVDAKLQAWLNEHMNSVAIWEQETDQDRISRAHSLLKTNPNHAFEEYLALAEQGSVWGMANVGTLFQRGIGTSADLTQAEKWYRRAYEGGSDYGLIWLGQLYANSHQYAKAEEVFRMGTERGCVPAMLRLAWVYLKSPDWRQKRGEALILLERASAAGDLSAKGFLANAMARGWFGLRRIPEGIRLIFKVSDQMVELTKDDESLSPKTNGNAPLVFLGRLVRRYSLTAVRLPVS